MCPDNRACEEIPILGGIRWLCSWWLRDDFIPDPKQSERGTRKLDLFCSYASQRRIWHPSVSPEPEIRCHMLDSTTNAAVRATQNGEPADPSRAVLFGIEPQRRKITHPVRLGSLRPSRSEPSCAHIKAGGPGIGIRVAQTLTSSSKKAL
jgi:hypothetical protein